MGASPLLGGLLVDKPSGMTSHDVVNRIRRAAGLRRVGHIGTLDPLATGLMVCLLGQATRLCDYLVGQDKRYACEAQLGVETDTYDADGQEVARAPESALPTDAGPIAEALGAMVGEIDQRPPIFSAVKVQGKRLYKYARAGQEAEIPLRRVHIHSLTVREYAPPVVRFDCHVSSGAYVRSICHDMGQALGCGAHLTALRRLTIGPFRVEDAHALDAIGQPDFSVSEALLKISDLLPGTPCITLDSRSVDRMRNGGQIVLPACPFPDGGHGVPPRQTAVMLDEHGAAVAVGLLEHCPDAEPGQGGHWVAQPRIVFTER